MMRASLISGATSSRAGTFLNVPSNFFASTSTQAGKPFCCASSSDSAMRTCFWAFFAHGDDVPGLDGVGRNVHLLAVDEDGAVADELAGFRARRAEAHAVDDVVETALRSWKSFSPVLPRRRAASAK